MNRKENMQACGLKPAAPTTADGYGVEAAAGRHGAEAVPGGTVGAGGFSRHFRKSLRNARIDYSRGTFFVTCQVARNKSIFGAIAGDQCILNELGRQVRDYWLAMPSKYPELNLDEFVVMPNHFHAILRILPAPGNREQHLGFLMGRFKGGTGYLYGKMRRAGLVEDIGDHLWQFDYWDDLVTSAEELENQRRYIRENPANWSRDRYGPCTDYFVGDIDLLNAPRIAFVASQGFPAAALRPRRIYGLKPAAPTKARCPDTAGASAGSAGAPSAAMPAPSERGASAPAPASRYEGTVIISTFTSAQEREALRRALAKGRRVIAVRPGGLPTEADRTDTDEMLLAAAREGRALLLSPQPPGSSLNKKVATWCNEYVLRHADEIWIGDISPNGMLSALMRGIFAG